MRPYLHDKICKITHTSILLAGRRSCCTWSSNKLHLCWWLGLQWDRKALWTCTFVSNDHWTKDEGLFILKTMIIGHRMKLFILMSGGFGLPTPDMATRKEYVTRIPLAAVFEGWATQSPPITRILVATERSRRRKKREKQKLAPYKIYSLRHSYI
jgi:hypothetical protein